MAVQQVIMVAPAQTTARVIIVQTTLEDHAPVLHVLLSITAVAHSVAAAAVAHSVAAAAAMEDHLAVAAAIAHSAVAAVVAPAVAAPVVEVLEEAAAAVAAIAAAAEAAVRSADTVNRRTSAFIIRCTSRIVHPA